MNHKKLQRNGHTTGRIREFESLQKSGVTICLKEPTVLQRNWQNDQYQYVDDGVDEDVDEDVNEDVDEEDADDDRGFLQGLVNDNEYVRSFKKALNPKSCEKYNQDLLKFNSKPGTSKNPSDNVTGFEVAIVRKDYPEKHLTKEESQIALNAILNAYEMITENGPQVRFNSNSLKDGYLLMSCADEESKKWLTCKIPNLIPRPGLHIKALSGPAIPKPYFYTVFISDENSEKLTLDRIITRLKNSNHILKPDRWTSWAIKPAEKGQTWIFNMDQQSVENLKKLDFQPYFGCGRLKFKPKRSMDRPEGGLKKPRGGTSKVSKRPKLMQTVRGTVPPNPSYHEMNASKSIWKTT